VDLDSIQHLVLVQIGQDGMARVLELLPKFSGRQPGGTACDQITNGGNQAAVSGKADPLVMPNTLVVKLRCISEGVMGRSMSEGLNSLEAYQEQLLATVKPLALKNEPGSVKTSQMIKYESLHFPNLLQPNATTKFCHNSKKIGNTSTPPLRPGNNGRNSRCYPPVMFSHWRLAIAARRALEGEYSIADNTTPGPVRKDYNLRRWCSFPFSPCP
jgi:hypothetical protein